MTRHRDTCQECSAAPLPGERRCQTCKDWHNLREARRREERREQGLCVPCGEPAIIDDDGYALSFCEGCRQKADAKRAREKRRRELAHHQERNSVKRKKGKQNGKEARS